MYVAIMYNVPELASRFRQRAVECIRLAELPIDRESRRDYRWLASCYLLLSEIEIQRATRAERHCDFAAWSRFRALCSA
jgi:hypothetical protein